MNFKVIFTLYKNVTSMFAKLECIDYTKRSNDDFLWFLSLMKTKLLELGRTDDLTVSCSLDSHVRICTCLYGLLVMGVFKCSVIDKGELVGVFTAMLHA